MCLTSMNLSMDALTLGEQPRMQLHNGASSKQLQFHLDGTSRPPALCASSEHTTPTLLQSRLSIIPSRTGTSVTDFSVSSSSMCKSTLHPIADKTELTSNDMRRKLRIEIECRLREKHKTLEAEKLEKFSRCIEHLLFVQHKRSSKDKSHDRVSDLNARLQPLMKRLLERKASKSSSQALEEQRRRSVILSMGSREIYSRATSLVQEIKRLRLEHASIGCSSGMCRNKASSGVPSCGAGTVPFPVANLFFGNIHLVRALEDVRFMKENKNEELPWDDWIREASSIVCNYKTWLLSERSDD